MTSDQPRPLDRQSFDAAELMADHPPRVCDANKEIVLDIACPPGAVHHGTLGFTRWAAMELPEQLDPVPPDLVLPVAGFFDYQPVIGGDDVVEWHVNFADPDVFAYYGGGLFAQDEMQVAEHPGLGALREALVAAGIDARTKTADRPTPILVTGVERRVAIETDPDAAAGRPHGLYGNAFAAARSRRRPASDDTHRPADRHQPGRDRGHRVRPWTLHGRADPPDARHGVHGLPSCGRGV